MSDAAARRYAQALIELAEDAGAIDRVGTDLERVAEALSAHDAQLGDALSSPVFTVEERRKVLDAVLPKLEVHPLVDNVLHLANDKHRMGLVPKIVDAYRAMADERAGRVRVTVQTAEPLTAQLETEVRQALEKLTGRTVVLHTEVDESLIAGLVARVGDKVYDSSLRTRLQQMRQSLLGSATAEA
ncbi:MAG: ATP synthase F1 subunit delta [Myxococcota bacterium]